MKLMISTLVVAGVSILTGCSSAEEQNCPDTQIARISALAASQSFVSQRLRDPRSAEFARYGDSAVRWVSHCEFFVVSTVRAQNGFGGYVNNRYMITIEYLPSQNTFQASDLIIE